MPSCFIKKRKLITSVESYKRPKHEDDSERYRCLEFCGNVNNWYLSQEIRSRTIPARGKFDTIRYVNIPRIESVSYLTGIANGLNTINNFGPGIRAGGIGCIEYNENFQCNGQE
ncbi:hypothetical protein CEXT_438771 [Caerostris extrusa]|uniref:Uncharacterized protein n=1 Tax=Caerostris extrusa TaxID=172846 RepID=A0AAV4YC43_CAEEX|nr:hypothetical protein CEXT_438771 [Caerostris extrusa]